MTSNAKAFLAASLVSLSFSAAACAGPRTGAPPADSDVGTAVEAWCHGYYVDHVVAHDGTVFFVSPDHLADATEGWGPQSLSLSVDKGFSPQTSYQATPSVAIQQDKVTKSLQAAVGFSLTTSTNLVAATSVLVPTDAYYRIEAYPEYQLVGWDLRLDPCGPMGDAFITTGSVYRPVGIYFRVMEYVGGAWNALRPPSPSEIPVPPTLASPGSQGAGSHGAGTTGTGSTGSADSGDAGRP